MDVNSDEGLKLCPLHLGQVLCGLVNQDVQQVQERLVCLLHDRSGVMVDRGGSVCDGRGGGVRRVWVGRGLGGVRWWRVGGTFS